MTDSDEVKLLPCETNKGLRLAQLRADLGRDTSIFVCRNVDGHVHVTLGRNATLIIHPHAAVRLCENISNVLAGKDSASA